MSAAAGGGVWEVEGSLEVKGLLEVEMDLAVAFEVGE
jgi:hypothetical protein